MPDYIYYYGFTAEQVAKLAVMPYKEALLYKKAHAKALADRLLSTHFTEQETHRINEVLKAVKFNERLLKELL